MVSVEQWAEVRRMHFVEGLGSGRSGGDAPQDADLAAINETAFEFGLQAVLDGLQARLQPGVVAGNQLDSRPRTGRLGRATCPGTGRVATIRGWKEPQQIMGPV